MNAYADEDTEAANSCEGPKREDSPSSGALRMKIPIPDCSEGDKAYKTSPIPSD